MKLQGLKDATHCDRSGGRFSTYRFLGIPSCFLEAEATLFWEPNPRVERWEENESVSERREEVGGRDDGHGDTMGAASGSIWYSAAVVAAKRGGEGG
jgi:hypothetical protein